MGTSRNWSRAHAKSHLGRMATTNMARGTVGIGHNTHIVVRRGRTGMLASGRSEETEEQSARRSLRAAQEKVLTEATRKPSMPRIDAAAAREALAGLRRLEDDDGDA